MTQLGYKIIFISIKQIYLLILDIKTKDDMKQIKVLFVSFAAVCIMFLGCDEHTTVEDLSSNFDSIANTGTVTDIDGNTYQTVKIGSLLWISENLKTTRYRNGDPIISGLREFDVENTDSGACTVFPHSEVEGINSDAEMADAYGMLYNWYAVNDDRGLCPAGWEVPSDRQWKELENYLEGWGVAGGKMKSTRTSPEPHPRWQSPNTGASNTSNFSALPGGNRLSDGFADKIGKQGQWWSSTGFDERSALGRVIYFNNAFLGAKDYPKNMGLSIRCVKTVIEQELGR